ncbi:MAG: sulfatase [Kiritimatiellales bacterium]
MKNFYNKLLLPAAAAAAASQAAPVTPPNVLLIMVDDLRPELGCYGNTQIISPNIDALAKEGILFQRAHCNVPVCGASRASLLTGVRPTPTRFVEAHTWAERDLPGNLSLPKHFKDCGYTTVSLGKVFHQKHDCADSWSAEPWWPDGYPHMWNAYVTKENQEEVRLSPKKIGPAWEIADCSDSSYPDGKTAEKAIEEMRELSSSEKPFFLAVGFLKPHLPHNAPKRYWDLYDAKTLQLADNRDKIPQNAPECSVHQSGELRHGYSGVPTQSPLPDDYEKILLHGYMACISYVDAQIGRVLNELKTSGLSENTIVILCGDNGYNLGEHTMWCKQCEYETSLGVPLMMKVPGIQGGKKVAGLVEYVDIYPTLCELCGIPIPGTCDGTSFAALLRNPDLPGKPAIFSRYEKGDTVTTERFQYTEYRSTKGSLIGRMLYDHKKDPSENVNVVDNPEYKSVIDRMAQMLQTQREEVLHASPSAK